MAAGAIQPTDKTLSSPQVTRSRPGFGAASFVHGRSSTAPPLTASAAPASSRTFDWGFRTSRAGRGRSGRAGCDVTLLTSSGQGRSGNLLDHLAAGPVQADST